MAGSRDNLRALGIDFCRSAVCSLRFGLHKCEPARFTKQMFGRRLRALRPDIQEAPAAEEEEQWVYLGIGLKSEPNAQGLRPWLPFEHGNERASNGGLMESLKCESLLQ